MPNNIALNQRIKHLLNRANKYRATGLIDGGEEDAIREEIRRCYYEDETFYGVSKKSVIILLRLNLSYRAIQLHHFGLSIKLEKLK